MDERTPSVPEMELVSPVEIRSYTYVRSAHIVRRPYVEKNAITPRRIWRQCTGACHRASTSLPPASSLPPCPRPFVPRSDVRAECQLFLRLSAGLTRDTLVPSDSRRPLRSSFFSSHLRRWSPSSHSAPSCTLKTRLRYPDRRYRIPYLSLSLSVFCRETWLRYPRELVRTRYFFCGSVLSGFLFQPLRQRQAVWWKNN